MIKILFVCHGNICRSTMAQSVFAYLADQRGLSDSFWVDSAATSTEETGNPPHRGTVMKLRQEGIPLIPHRAWQITARDYDDYDLILGMDDWNIKNLHRILKGDPQGKVRKLLSYAGSQRAFQMKGIFCQAHHRLCPKGKKSACHKG